MKRIISVDGGKGGTGKSVVSTACLDVVLTAGKKVLLVEADTSNPDVAKTYEGACETLTIEIDTSDGFISLATAIYNTRAETIIINNPARSQGWLTHGRLLIDNLAACNAKMTTLWVANRQIDSCQLLLDYQESLPEIQVIFTMNQYFGNQSKFEVWIESGEKGIRAYIFKHGGGEILFPDCADRVMNEMRNNRMRWDKIVDMPFGNLIEAERVRREFTKILGPIIL